MSDRIEEPSGTDTVRALTGVAAPVELAQPDRAETSLLQNDTLADQEIDRQGHGHDERDDKDDIEA